MTIGAMGHDGDCSCTVDAVLDAYLAAPAFSAKTRVDYASNLTRRHGQAVSARTRTLMGTAVTAAFMDGHVQGVDEDLSKDNNQILLKQ